jgi:hypothetical protein
MVLLEVFDGYRRGKWKNSKVPWAEISVEIKKRFLLAFWVEASTASMVIRLPCSDRALACVRLLCL